MNSQQDQSRAIGGQASSDRLHITDDFGISTLVYAPMMTDLYICEPFYR
jgi:hypothetical protein